MTTPSLAALNLPGRLDGIDVSEVQGKIDWPRVAAAGFLFVIVKASEGATYCDPRALANLDGARRAGLAAFVYAFARPGQGSPRAQAERLWTCSGDVMPARAFLDLEYAPATMSPAEIVAFAEAFADEWRQFSALECGVYTMPYFAQSRGGQALASSVRLARCPLWIAQYRSTTAPWAPAAVNVPHVPLPWQDWAFWQYSGDGGYRVPGVPEDCDRNLFNGDRAALRRFLGLPPDPVADTLPPDAPTLPELGALAAEGIADAAVDEEQRKG